MIKNWRTFSLRLLIALAILGVIYASAVPLPRYIKQHRSAPNQELHEIRSNLNEGLVSLSSIRQLKGQDNNVAQLLTSSRSSLENSKSKLVEKLNNPSKNLSEETKSQINSLLDKQSTFLKSFDESYQLLSKPLEYNPDFDLGRLDINKDKNEIANRANSASNALKKIAEDLKASNGSININSSTGSSSPQITAYKVLLDSSDCFASLSRQISDSTQDPKNMLDTCNKDFKETRHKLVAYLISGLDSQILDEYKSLISKIDRQIKT